MKGREKRGEGEKGKGRRERVNNSLSIECFPLCS